jgi:hypothetical protein
VGQAGEAIRQGLTRRSQDNYYCQTLAKQGESSRVNKVYTTKGERKMTHIDAFKEALRLAITAPTDSQAALATQLAQDFAQGNLT